MKNIHSNDALDKETKKQQVVALRKEHQEEIKGILTPEQLEKMKEQGQGAAAGNTTQPIGGGAAANQTQNAALRTR